MLDLPLGGGATQVAGTGGAAVVTGGQAPAVATVSPAAPAPDAALRVEAASPTPDAAAETARILDMTPAPQPAELPQGNDAARLAALARPRIATLPDGQAPALPVALLAARDFATSRKADQGFNPGVMPLPLPPGGARAPSGQGQAGKSDQEGGFLDLLSLKSLPIPTFGGVQAAHAAAIDMPVPPTPAPTSPFTPAEQAAPLANAPRVLPGAPAIPANIPQGQGANGAPLPTRVGSRTQDMLPPLPNPSGQGIVPPAPVVGDAPLHEDPEVKAGEIARQQQDILMLRQQMDQRLKDLQSAEQKMKEMIREAKTLEDQKIRSLVQMYANMKPRTAAQAMENMDERVAVRILSGMPPKQSGEILTYTNPSKTAKFTELLTRMRMAE